MNMLPQTEYVSEIGFYEKNRDKKRTVDKVV